MLRVIDLIAAEDTPPHTAKAFKARLAITIMSDAETPFIRDPGYRLISIVLKAGVRIVPSFPKPVQELLL